MREEMERGWYLLPHEKIIARKQVPVLSPILAWLGFNRTKMIDLYSMVKRAYRSPNTIEKMMAYPFPLEHDNFPKPEQYPFYYRLLDGWVIESKSARFLKDGPLFSQNSSRVIIHSRVFVRSLLQQVWKVVTVFGVLLGITMSVLKLLGVL
jgi:hypothetical protein